jgi:hypothetical protein
MRCVSSKNSRCVNGLLLMLISTCEWNNVVSLISTWNRPGQIITTSLVVRSYVLIKLGISSLICYILWLLLWPPVTVDNSYTFIGQHGILIHFFLVFNTLLQISIWHLYLIPVIYGRSHILFVVLEVDLSGCSGTFVFIRVESIPRLQWSVFLSRSRTPWPWKLISVW